MKLMTRAGVVLSCVVAARPAFSAQVKEIPKVGLLQYLQIGYAGSARDLLAAAELMPEGEYGFKPTHMSEARTFGAVIAHTSAAMFDACWRLIGAANPAPQAEATITPKAEWCGC